MFYSQVWLCDPVWPSEWPYAYLLPHSSPAGWNVDVTAECQKSFWPGRQKPCFRGGWATERAWVPGASCGCTTNLPTLSPVQRESNQLHAALVSESNAPIQGRHTQDLGMIRG